MMRRTPLKRTGFKRKPPPARRSAPAVKRMTAPAAPGPRATMARIVDQVLTVHKVPRDENPRLLAMARGGSCLFLWVAGCRGEEGSTTVQAHENAIEANKGMGTKAHDWRSVRACCVCHTAYDQGNAAQEEKVAAFEAAMRRQRRDWDETANSPTAKAKDRAAALWALERWKKFEEQGKGCINV